MAKKLSLQGQLAGSFVLVGFIAAIVGGIGWQGTIKLSEQISVLSDIVLPSINGLWEINEGQTQIESSERRLLLNLNSTERNNEFDRIEQAWKQIEQGFAQYEVTVRTEEEEIYYQSLLNTWDAWEKAHRQYLNLYQDLITQQGQNPNSSRVAELNRALIAQANQNHEVMAAAEADLLRLIQINETVGNAATEKASQLATQTVVLATGGAIVGFGTSLGLGIILSVLIAKPLNRKVAGIVQAVVSSSSEIAATMEQQERAANQQAASVSETTTTMDELDASSRQSAQQAESSALGASQALVLAEGGTIAVDRTMQGMDALRQKVGAIADQILRLSEQTSQIGNISSLVSDLANQTNMLALNAAVEAVRAGEHGKGFTVVSSEIRKLADQSRKSAERINALVADIQGAINSTVMVTDEGTKTVDQSVEVAQEMAQAFLGVTEAVNNVVLNSQQISLNIKQQAIAIQQVTNAMGALKNSTQETARGITQAKVGTQQLNQAAVDLQTIT